jgi:hypothetical protein
VRTFLNLPTNPAAEKPAIDTLGLTFYGPSLGFTKDIGPTNFIEQTYVQDVVGILCGIAALKTLEQCVHEGANADTIG